MSILKGSGRFALGTVAFAVLLVGIVFAVDEHFSSKAESYVGKFYDVQVLSDCAVNINKARRTHGETPKDGEVIRTFGWPTEIPIQIPDLPRHKAYELRNLNPQNAFLAKEKYKKEVPVVTIAVLQGELSLQKPVMPQGMWVKNGEKGGWYLLVVKAPVPPTIEPK